LENKPAYLPKPKDNLIKKYVTNLDKLLENISVVLELLEIRNPVACIEESFRARCQEKNIKIISILTKCDTLK
jgi:GTP-binding protein EngB required for normal cell division